MVWFQFLVILMISCQKAFSVVNNDNNYRVFLNGTSARGDLKWSCSGVLLSTDYIMTAANCVEGDGIMDVTSVDGTKVTSFPTLLAIPHDKYHYYYYNNDIALVPVKDSSKTERISKFARLPRNQDDECKGNATLYTSRSRQPLKMTIVPTRRCSKIYRERFDHPLMMWDFKICAKLTAKNKTARIESGAPLVSSNGEVIGIASFGPTKLDPYVPIVFTKVANYLDFITEITDFGLGNI